MLSLKKINSTINLNEHYFINSYFSRNTLWHSQTTRMGGKDISNKVFTFGMLLAETTWVDIKWQHQSFITHILLRLFFWDNVLKQTTQQTTEKKDIYIFCIISNMKINVHVKCHDHRQPRRFRAPVVSSRLAQSTGGSEGLRGHGTSVCGLWLVTHSQACLCFLSFVSNKNLGNQSFCLRWLLWNPKRPHQSFLAMLWPSSNGLQTHFGLALPSSRTEIHETTYIPHHEFHFEQKPAWQGKLKMEKTYQPYVSFSHCLSAVSFQS